MNYPYWANYLPWGTVTAMKKWLQKHYPSVNCSLSGSIFEAIEKYHPGGCQGFVKTYCYRLEK